MNDFITNAKSVWLIVVGVLASGFTQLMGVLPDDMGKLTSLSGLCVAIAMFNKLRAESRKAAADQRKTQRETELLELEIKKRKGESE